MNEKMCEKCKEAPGTESTRLMSGRVVLLCKDCKGKIFAMRAKLARIMSELDEEDANVFTIE